MWRFYLAATVIVAVFVFAATLHERSRPDLEISARASGTPSAPRSQAAGSATPAGVRGDAPWALSALPDCARQHAERRGTPAYVRRAIPRNARLVRGRVTAGPCEIDASGSGIAIARGNDRLRIPPPAQLFEANGRYFLYERDRKEAVLRVYTFRNGASP